MHTSSISDRCKSPPDDGQGRTASPAMDAFSPFSRTYDTADGTNSVCSHPHPQGAVGAKERYPARADLLRKPERVRYTQPGHTRGSRSRRTSARQDSGDRSRRAAPSARESPQHPSRGGSPAAGGSSGRDSRNQCRSSPTIRGQLFSGSRDPMHSEFVAFGSLRSAPPAGGRPKHSQL